MKVLQWSMTIPKEKQKEFVKEIIGKQVREKDRFIERVYFDDNFNIPSYFTNVKDNPEAWRISRMYDGEFETKDIELRVLNEVSL
jgi:hypothetical protein